MNEATPDVKRWSLEEERMRQSFTSTTDSYFIKRSYGAQTLDVSIGKKISEKELKTIDPILNNDDNDKKEILALIKYEITKSLKFNYSINDNAFKSIAELLNIKREDICRICEDAFCSIKTIDDLKEVFIRNNWILNYQDNDAHTIAIESNICGLIQEIVIYSNKSKYDYSKLFDKYPNLFKDEDFDIEKEDYQFILERVKVIYGNLTYNEKNKEKKIKMLLSNEEQALSKTRLFSQFVLFLTRQKEIKDV